MASTATATRFTIETDGEPMHPREDTEPLGTIAGRTGRYSYADPGHGDERWTRDDTLAHIVRECGGDPETGGDLETLADSLAVVLPFYTYAHSVVLFSVAPFGCQWDSGQTGYIYASKEKIRKEYGNDSEETLETVRKVLAAEVATLSAYSSGSVYGARLLNADGEEVDACWGFYGNDHESSGLMEWVRQYLPDATTPWPG